jgi:hypothetical protein
MSSLLCFLILLGACFLLLTTEKTIHPFAKRPEMRALIEI